MLNGKSAPFHNLVFLAKSGKHNRNCPQLHYSTLSVSQVGTHCHSSVTEHGTRQCVKSRTAVVICDWLGNRIKHIIRGHAFNHHNLVIRAFMIQNIKNIRAFTMKSKQNKKTNLLFDGWLVTAPSSKVIVESEQLFEQGIEVVLVHCNGRDWLCLHIKVCSTNPSQVALQLVVKEYVSLQRWMLQASDCWKNNLRLRTNIHSSAVFLQPLFSNCISPTILDTLKRGGRSLKSSKWKYPASSYIL